MADKTTTLKTKTNDNVYPNIIGDNRDNAIVNSAHIKHTLTADHKINFRLDDNVSNLIFNSLQKPAGLTKTKLVGVGTNGQENIEIGDNLTLANGKLSATGGGSGGQFCLVTLDINNNTYTTNIPLPTDGTTPVFVDLLAFGMILPVTYPYTPDSDGSRKISAMSNDGYTFYAVTLKSDGTLTYKIFEMATYTHFITLSNQTLGTIYINLVNFYNWEIDLYDLKTYLDGKSLACSGFVKKDGQRMNATYIKSFNNMLVVHYFDTSGEGSLGIDDTFSITDEFIPNN